MWWTLGSSLSSPSASFSTGLWHQILGTQDKTSHRYLHLSKGSWALVREPHYFRVLLVFFVFVFYFFKKCQETHLHQDDLFTKNKNLSSGPNRCLVWLLKVRATACVCWTALNISPEQAPSLGLLSIRVWWDAKKWTSLLSRLQVWGCYPSGFGGMLRSGV